MEFSEGREHCETFKVCTNYKYNVGLYAENSQENEKKIIDCRKRDDQIVTKKSEMRKEQLKRT